MGYASVSATKSSYSRPRRLPDQDPGSTLATVLRLKELRLPLPEALMAGTPLTDLSETGDTYFTNEFVIL